jgi:threonine dehydratase
LVKRSISSDDVRAAHARIRPHIHRTPIFTNRAIDELLGARVVFKCENLQRGGAFKTRGALHAVLSLTDAEAAAGVATHSSGNHGAALAIAARIRGIPAYIVVPTNAPRVKRAAIVGYGATIIDCEPTVPAREAMLADVVARTGAHFVPPYDDPRIVAGAGTAALELLEQAPDLEQIWVPVGGGGLASGTTIVARDAGVRVVAAEPAAADDAYRSLASGRIKPMPNPQTIADGLRTPLGQINFDILSGAGVTVALATEAAIIRATRLFFERMKLVVEPSGAVPLAALLEAPAAAKAQRIGAIISGGNADLDALLTAFKNVPAY